MNYLNDCAEVGTTSERGMQRHTPTRLLTAVLSLLFVVGCTTGEQISQVKEGMSREDVVRRLGNPDGFERHGDAEVLRYTNRLISGWSWDRADYRVVLVDGVVTEYGAETVRQVRPANTVIVVPGQ